MLKRHSNDEEGKPHTAVKTSNMHPPLTPTTFGRLSIYQRQRVFAVTCTYLNSFALVYTDPEPR